MNQPLFFPRRSCRFSMALRGLSPEVILNSHLPAPYDMAEELLQLLAEAPVQKPFIGPDQKTFEAMLRGRAAA